MFRTIEVEITGRTPLLMHNPNAMLLARNCTTKPIGTKVPEPAVEAEQSAYRNEKTKELYIPSTAIFGAIINASKQYKVGKTSASSLIGGAVRVEGLNKEVPMEVGLGTKEYEIDAQRCVVQRQGIIRCRAKLNSWKARFKIIADDSFIKADLIERILQDAGIRCGLLDFRPQRKGSYGTFQVTKFKANGEK